MSDFVMPPKGLGKAVSKKCPDCKKQVRLCLLNSHDDTVLASLCLILGVFSGPCAVCGYN